MTDNPPRIAAEIERALASLATLADPREAERTRELASLLMSLYGSALARVVEIATAASAESDTLERLAADPLLSSLLALHGLHPDPAAIRITRALSSITPALPRGCAVVLVTADNESAHIRVTGLKSGQAQYDNIRRMLEHAIQEAAPEIATIQIDGLESSLLQVIRPTPVVASTP